MNPLTRLARVAAESDLPDGDFKIGPAYTDAPELAVKDGVPKGTLREFTMDSSDSKIYPGLTGPYKRQAAVYVPDGYVPDTPAPFIVVQDGMSYKDALSRILDNMIHDRRLP
jgi:enterochelin esterase family protein